MKKENIIKAQATEKEKDETGIKSKKALRLIVLFFFIMLAFTIISRITDSMLIPRVKTVAVSGGCLSWTVQGEGNVDMRDKSYVSILEGLHISELCANPGQTVKEGEDILFYYNVGDIEKRLQQERTELNKLNAELQTIKVSYSLDQPLCDANCQQVEIKIYEQQKKVNLLRNLLKNDGAVYAAVDGTVVDFGLTLGKLTDGKEAVSVGTGEVTFIGTVSSKEAEQINIGDSMQLINLSGGKNKAVTVDSIRMSEDGQTALIYADASKIGAVAGQRFKLKIESQSDRFETVVPISALHMQSNADYYVFAVSQIKTVLGTQTVAREVKVNVISKSKTEAAIECSIGSDERIISSSSREIAGGDRVRVYE